MRQVAKYLPKSVDVGGFDFIERVLDGADTVGYVEVLPTFPDAKFVVRLHSLQDVTEGVVGVTHLEGGNYSFVKWLY